jgi:hypothetical protein
MPTTPCLLCMGLFSIFWLGASRASIISYIDDFKLMMILSLAAIPLVLLLRSAPASGESDHAMVME